MAKKQNNPIIIVNCFQASIPVLLVIKPLLQPLNISLKDSHETFWSVFRLLHSQNLNCIPIIQVRFLSVLTRMQKTQTNMNFLRKTEFFFKSNLWRRYFKFPSCILSSIELLCSKRSYLRKCCSFFLWLFWIFSG